MQTLSPSELPWGRARLRGTLHGVPRRSHPQEGFPISAFLTALLLSGRSPQCVVSGSQQLLCAWRARAAGRSLGLRLGSTCTFLAQLTPLGNNRPEHGPKVGSRHWQHPGDPLGSGTR